MGSCKHGIEHSGSIKCVEVLDWLTKYWLFKNCAPWNRLVNNFECFLLRFVDTRGKTKFHGNLDRFALTPIPVSQQAVPASCPAVAVYRYGTYTAVRTQSQAVGAFRFLRSIEHFLVVVPRCITVTWLSENPASVKRIALQANALRYIRITRTDR